MSLAVGLSLWFNHHWKFRTKAGNGSYQAWNGRRIRVYIESRLKVCSHLLWVCQGGCLPGGCLPGGVGVSAWGGYKACWDTHPPLWTEFFTHANENITLPQTSFAGGNEYSDGEGDRDGPGKCKQASRLVHTYGLFPLQDSHSNTNSRTMQILWERDPNLNPSQWKHVLHNTIWPHRLKSEFGSGNKSVWNVQCSHLVCSLNHNRNRNPDPAT